MESSVVKYLSFKANKVRWQPTQAEGITCSTILATGSGDEEVAKVTVDVFIISLSNSGSMCASVCGLFCAPGIVTLESFVGQLKCLVHSDYCVQFR